MHPWATFHMQIIAFCASSLEAHVHLKVQNVFVPSPRVPKVQDKLCCEPTPGGEGERGGIIQLPRDNGSG